MSFFTYLRYGLAATMFLLMAAFLHYSLPDRDIVQIVGTEVVRMDNVERSDGTVVNVDQPRINAVWPDGAPSVYRNDDTDWSWPPYFKFDSANLQAEAQSYANRGGTRDWVVIRHYGWRIPIFSMFPNALSVRDAEGPDEQLVPWFNIVLISFLVVTLLVIRRVMIILFDRHVAPVVDSIDQEFDETADALSDRYRGLKGWFRRLMGR
ncbi:MAG: DUF1523 family protein [Pseudomonadota bacterium]